MGQRQARELIVDQGRHDADLRKPVPDGEILQPVGHEERHHLAAPQVQPLAPVGEAVGDCVEFAVAHSATFEGQGGALAPLVDSGLDVVANQVRTVRRDRFHAFQRPVQPAQETPLALELGLKRHTDLRLECQLGDWANAGSSFCSPASWPQRR